MYSVVVGDLSNQWNARVGSDGGADSTQVDCDLWQLVWDNRQGEAIRFSTGNQVDVAQGDQERIVDKQLAIVKSNVVRRRVTQGHRGLELALLALGAGFGQEQRAIRQNPI